ncbi:hypothetical protein KKR91_04165 [Arthrobacter jiangjiafuii]|uniref:Uncharacterized protein n=1 Tax=Arthrobacter jiangjiafuii TaxID=2817475 RepID=A0A975M6I2_9MICC|nr:hypothetical protein [Arthrobacter jiangjiafuii]MBP3043801.1 hypothetical protein [Arthrobacter jiangjiafuii]QWC10822.1 hypothetical protein KKR91_04165 [Arthrobacter jiangjiafuii]
MDPASVPHAAPSPALPPDQPQHAVSLQAVSLQDYEQLTSARACFVDFLLSHPGAAG